MARTAHWLAQGLLGFWDSWDSGFWDSGLGILDSGLRILDSGRGGRLQAACRPPRASSLTVPYGTLRYLTVFCIRYLTVPFGILDSGFWDSGILGYSGPRGCERSPARAGELDLSVRSSKLELVLESINLAIFFGLLINLLKLLKDPVIAGHVSENGHVAVLLTQSVRIWQARSLILNQSTRRSFGTSLPQE